jgi:hypothetical protein
MPEIERLCVVCGRPFVQTRSNGRPWKFCGAHCRAAAEAARVQSWRDADPDRARTLNREGARRRRAAARVPIERSKEADTVEEQEAA